MTYLRNLAFLFVVIIAQSFLVINSQANTIFLSGDSGIGNPIDGSSTSFVNPNNAIWFTNILEEGTNVLILYDITFGPSAGSSAISINTHYNSLSGISSNIAASGTIIDTLLLNGVDLFISVLPTNSFSISELNAMAGFLSGGGTLFFMGENNEHSSNQNSVINSALNYLGSSMRLLNSSLDPLYHTTTNIDDDVFNMGVTDFTYAYTNTLAIVNGTSLIRTIGGETFIAYENILSIPTLTPTPSPTPTPIPTPTPTPSPTPNPNHTTLSIHQGSASSPNIPCTTGSCFGMEVAPGFRAWTDIVGGTDGGIIVDKPQLPGTQVNGPSSEAADSGELTEAWFFFGNFGTFTTAAVSGGVAGFATFDATSNIFGDVSCAKDTCVGITELSAWHVAWNGIVVPMGNAEGCLSAGCTPDQLARINTDSYTITYTDGTGPYELHYSNVVPDGDPSGFGNVAFSLTLRGTATKAIGNKIPIANDVHAMDVYERLISWLPDVVDSDGPDALTCTIVTAPLRGIATVAADCTSGTYQAEPYPYIESFTYAAYDGVDTSAAATVTIAVEDPYSHGTPTPTPPPSLCKKTYPIKMHSITGKKGTISANFTGNIISITKKRIEICPSSSLEYEVTSTNGGVQCKNKSSATATSGTLIQNDKLKCKDNQPTGSGSTNGHDKIKFKVKVNNHI